VTRGDVRRRSPRGQTLVEFALILPLFFLMLIGIFDLGRAAYDFNTLSNAAREAVRRAIVDQNVTAIIDTAIQHAASINVGASDVAVEFRSADLSTTCAAGHASDPIRIGCVAVIKVQYDYTAATPLVGNLVGVIHMSATTRQAIESVWQSP
jgi:Flp pilus assembly protein TadG